MVIQRVLMKGITLCLVGSTWGQLARWVFYQYQLAGLLMGLLGIAVTLSIWYLYYRERNTESYFLLFWFVVGIVLGLGI